MRSIAWLLGAVLTAAACGEGELDLAKQIVIAEEHEEAARRELLRLEHEMASLTPGEPTAALQAKIEAQREVVRAAEIAARKLRIQSKQ